MNLGWQQGQIKIKEIQIETYIEPLVPCSATLIADDSIRQVFRLAGPKGTIYPVLE